MRLKCHVKASGREPLGLPSGSVVKNPPASAGDFGLIPGLGRSPGEGNNYPFQYSSQENSMDCVVHGVAKIRTQLSEFHFHFTRKKENLPTKL